MAGSELVSASARKSTAFAAIKTLGVGPRQFRCIASDGTPDRAGDVLDPYGVKLDAFRKNPVILAQHDSTAPIARCARIGIEGNQVVALVEFPPEGVSDKADEYCRLIKAGVISAVSVGFIPLRWEPIKGSGLKFLEWEMIELSVVSVPCNPSALITERSFSTVADDGQSAARLAKARTLQRRLSGTVKPAAYNPDDGTPKTVEAAREVAKRLRERNGLKRLDPALIAADAAFRMRTW
jgi:HK97 family phage prohead protease